VSAFVIIGTMPTRITFGTRGRKVLQELRLPMVWVLILGIRFQHAICAA
jgi:hypothetical protein